MRGQSADASLLSLRIPSIWEGYRRQSLGFLLLCLYLVIEYLRPQYVYPAIDVIPWGQVSLGACLLFVLLEKRTRRGFVLMDLLIFGFFLWVFLSALSAFRPSESWRVWQAPVNWFFLYVLITFLIRSPRRAFLFFLVFFVINLKMSQHGARTWVGRGFAFTDWGVTGSPGWFQNSGEFAMEMAGFLGLSWCFLLSIRRDLGKWKSRILFLAFPITAAASVLGSSSRGGQLAAVAVVFSILIVQRIRLRTITVAGLFLVLGWYFVPTEQRARFSAIGEDDSSQARLTYWKAAFETAQEHPILGIGYNNWPVYYGALQRTYYTERIHNTTLQAAAELGFPGAALFIGMIIVSFVTNRRTRRRARMLGLWARPIWGMATGLDVMMIGFIVAAQFMSVLYYPIFWVSFGLSTALAEASRSELARFRGVSSLQVQNGKRSKVPPTERKPVESAYP